MHQLLTITWDMPYGLELGSFTLRYYSLLFAGGFFAGFFVIKRIFASENIPEKWLDSLVTYMVLATIIGARLGHVFFYEWSYYKEHPGKILAVWEGGLASHGAAVAIIVALIIFSRKITKKNALWILDRIVIVVALAGAFIRTGNYMNSEIYGNPSNSAIETVFLHPTKQSLLNSYGDRFTDVRFNETGAREETDSLTYPVYNLEIDFADGTNPLNAKQFVERYVAGLLNNQSPDNKNVIVLAETQATLTDEGMAPTVEMKVLGVPRYPTQWIEALAYLMIFVLLFALYWRTEKKHQMGFLFGTFLVTVFGFRFFVEYLKANQVAFEEGMALNMGQWLSIPLVIAGLYFMFTSNKRKDDSIA